jgi:5-(carboxyamino)imidazole ribonucleotide synthase
MPCSRHPTPGSQAIRRNGIVKKVGIIGAGQLGQMLGFAADALNVQCTFLDPAENPPAAAAGTVIPLPFDSTQGLKQLAEWADVITYEFENVPVSALASIPDKIPVYPPREALTCSQDRLDEKKLFESLQIPLPQYRAIDSAADLQNAASEIGLPLVLKTRRLGYDGKGQRVVSTMEQVAPSFEELGGRELIAEQWVDFDYEVSAIGVRAPNGETTSYSLTQNLHEGGILRVSRAPVDQPQLARLADDYLDRLMRHLDYVGVLALELFVVGDRLLANEFAPRVHNSGHWTIEGATASQFENHLRAILEMPLGDTTMAGYVGMINLIGNMPEDSARIVAENVALHDYGKEPRRDRKLGHVTLVAEDRLQREAHLETLLARIRQG